MQPGEVRLATCLSNQLIEEEKGNVEGELIWVVLCCSVFLFFLIPCRLAPLYIRVLKIEDSTEIRWPVAIGDVMLSSMVLWLA